MNDKNRNSSIELLRILAGMAVVVLHFNYRAGGGAIEISNGIDKEILLLLEALCIGAVNIFILIAGYFNVDATKINISRLISIIIQTSIFSFIFYLASSIMNSAYSIIGLLGALLPINYYVILYVTLMIIAPFLNIVINYIDVRSQRLLLFIIMGLFSVYPTLVDMLEECTKREFHGLSSISLMGSGSGYTIVNFTIVYMIGAILRKNDIASKVKNLHLYAAFLISLIIIYIWEKALPNTALIYSNPILIIESICIFLIFAKMNVKSKFINTVAPASFTCF